MAEAYAIAWRKQAVIPSGAELGWLIGVTRRVLANAKRGQRRIGALRTLLGSQPSIPGPDPADRIADADLRAAMLCLAPLDREALVLIAWFDLTPKDAAHAIGVTPAAFRMRLSRARRRLRADLPATTLLKEEPRWNTL